MDYFTYKKEKISCKHCNWSGIGEEAKMGEYFNVGFEIDCPQCGINFPDLIVFPSLEETVLKGNAENDGGRNIRDFEVYSYSEKVNFLNLPMHNLQNLLQEYLVSGSLKKSLVGISTCYASLVK